MHTIINDRKNMFSNYSIKCFNIQLNLMVMGTNTSRYVIQNSVRIIVSNMQSSEVILCNWMCFSL